MRGLGNFAITIAIAILAAPCLIVRAEPVWPQMREFELSFGVYLNAHRNEINIPQGEIRYWIFCRGDNREVDELVARRSQEEGQEVEHNPYGPWWPLACHLNPGARRLPEPEIGWAIGTLLAPLGTPSRPYQTRGKVLGNDLVGACADYPEYGRVRHFRLRGFELTFEFTDIVIEPDTPELTLERPFVSPVEYAVMHISLRRDPMAQTARAEPSGYLDPFRQSVPPQPRSCETPLKGKQPRSCYIPLTKNRGKCKPEWAYEPASFETRPYAVIQDKKKRHTKGKEADSFSPQYIEATLEIVRSAARARNGMLLRSILPELPFPLVCGKAGTPEWEALRVAGSDDWNRLWRIMLAHSAFQGFEELNAEEANLSPHYGVWLRGETFRFQAGLTVATKLSCNHLRNALEEGQ